MWKRRAVIVAITVVAAGAAVVSPASRRRHAPPVSYEQYTHIEKGMSPEEVEAIIGGPPGDHRTEDVVTMIPSVDFMEGCDLSLASEWRGNKGTIYVGWWNGRVVYSAFCEVRPAPAPPTFWAKVKRAAGQLRFP